MDITKSRIYYFGNERHRVGDYFKIIKMSLPLTRVRYNYVTRNLSFFYIDGNSNSYEDFLFLNLFIKKRIYDFQLMFLPETLFDQQASVLLAAKRTAPIKSQHLYKVLLKYDRFINFYNKRFIYKILLLIRPSQLNTVYYRCRIRYIWRFQKSRKIKQKNASSDFSKKFGTAYKRFVKNPNPNPNSNSNLQPPQRQRQLSPRLRYNLRKFPKLRKILKKMQRLRITINNRKYMVVKNYNKKMEKLIKSMKLIKLKNIYFLRRS